MLSRFAFRILHVEWAVFSKLLQFCKHKSALYPLALLIITFHISHNQTAFRSPGPHGRFSHHYQRMGNFIVPFHVPYPVIRLVERRPGTATEQHVITIVSQNTSIPR